MARAGRGIRLVPVPPATIQLLLCAARHAIGLAAHFKTLFRSAAVATISEIGTGALPCISERKCNRISAGQGVERRRSHGRERKAAAHRQYIEESLENNEEVGINVGRMRSNNRSERTQVRDDSQPPARPDVFTGLWSSESGIPADPHTGPLTRVFAGGRG
jgi:hypothetical protein